MNNTSINNVWHLVIDRKQIQPSIKNTLITLPKATTFYFKIAYIN